MLNRRQLAFAAAAMVCACSGPAAGTSSRSSAPTATPDVQATVAAAVQATSQALAKATASAPPITQPIPPKPEPKVLPSLSQAAPSQTFQGETSTAQKLTLHAGLAIFRMRASSPREAYFSFALLELDGSRQLAILGSGFSTPYEAASVTNVPRSGEFLLRVEARGTSNVSASLATEKLVTFPVRWGLTVAQPRPTQAPDAPLSLSGVRGDFLSAFFTLRRGATIFKLKAQPSQERFRAKLYDSDGHLVDLLAEASEGDGFDGAREVRIVNDGVHILRVEAGGPWLINTEGAAPARPAGAPARPFEPTS
jgi:hypothetical protein